MEDMSNKSHGSNLWRLSSEQQQQQPADQERVGSAPVLSSPQHHQRPRRRSKEPTAIKSGLAAAAAVANTGSPTDADAGKGFSAFVKGEVTGRAEGAGPPWQSAAAVTASVVRVTRGTDKRPKPNRQLFPHPEPESHAAEPLPEAAAVSERQRAFPAISDFPHARGAAEALAEGMGGVGEAEMACAGGGESGGERQTRVEGDGAGILVWGEEKDRETAREKVKLMRGEEEEEEEEGEEENGEEEEEEEDWMKEVRAAWSERRGSARRAGSKGVGNEEQPTPAAEAALAHGSAQASATAAADAAVTPSLLPPLLPFPAPERWEEDPVYQGMAYVGCAHQYTPAHFLRFLANWRLQQESGSRST
ncbi:hypothetical protein CLOM_g8149 [Closterium sp. NIES-68]|nr:hypothetical protein CLOM_g8149 [Closterium sp. NIES-68]